MQVEIVEIDPPTPRDHRTDGDDPRGGRGEERGQQQPGKREMPEMISPEGQLEPVARGPPVRHSHHTSVVDQHRDLRMRVDNRRGEVTHRAQIGEIKNSGRHRAFRVRITNAPSSRVKRAAVTPSKDDMHTMARQPEPCLEPDPSGPTGNDSSPHLPDPLSD